MILQALHFESIFIIIVPLNPDITVIKSSLREVLESVNGVEFYSVNSGRSKTTTGTEQRRRYWGILRAKDILARLKANRRFGATETAAVSKRF